MRLRLAVPLLVATVAALLPPSLAPAGAQAPGQVRAASVTVTENRVPVFPGLERRELSLRLDDGNPAVANVLSFAATDPLLELRPVLGGGAVHGLETVPSMGSRLLPEGGVAGINGGFWLNNPVGDPNGYVAVDHQLVSEAQTQGGGPRGTVASLPDGQLLMDRLQTNQDVAVGDAAAARLNGVNRYHSAALPHPDGDHASFLYTPSFGATVAVRSLGGGLPVRAFVVDGLSPPASGATSGVVRSVLTSSGDVPIPEGGAVIVAHGDHASRFAAAAPGAPARVGVGLQPERTDAQAWAQLRHGLAAGPLIVQNGARTDPATWEVEGFAPGVHSNVRHPRSAIGRTADGQVLLVTVDGRQRGYSVGMTMHELSHLLLRLGAVEGLSLDGGGSTQMVTDGRVRNRPCCDPSLRPVATGLFVRHSYDFPASERLAGTTRAGTAAAIARSSHPQGASEVLLARQDTFPDALAAGPLAADRDAPLLLTERDGLPPETAEALEQLGPERVTLLGGPAAVSRELEGALATRYQVTRVAGPNRFATAAAVARQMGGLHLRAFLVVGTAFPDALSASAPAGMLGMPILLTETDQLPDVTRQVLRDSLVREVVIVGGPGVVSERIVDELRGDLILATRVAGPTRYATARQVNDWARLQIPLMDQRGLVVALGERFPDALAGGPLAAMRRQPLMIVPGIDVNRNEDVAAFLRERDLLLAEATLLGGHGALSSFQHWQLDQLAR